MQREALCRFRMKSRVTTGLVCLSLILLPTASLAVIVSDVPNPQQVYGGSVTDMANILSPETETTLNLLIDQLEQKNGTEIAVVTVPETQPSASPKEFATELFNTWHIGKAESDNGLLFLVSYGERRVEIEIGYGLEAILPDARVGKIIDTHVLPHFKQGDFDQGILAGTEAIVITLETSLGAEGESIVSGGKSAQPNSWWLWILGGGTALVGLLGANVIRRPYELEPEGYSPQGWAIPFQRLRCARCHGPLEPLSSKDVEDHLTDAQQVANRIGSMSFKGYRCPHCQAETTGQKVQIVGHQRAFSGYQLCPNCKTWTVERTNQVLTPATSYRIGKRLISDACLVCDYHHQEEQVIRQKAHHHAGFGGGSGSSGGGFGGGSSGGGGGGGSW